MKKQRGLKRYYRKLEVENEFYKLQWLDLEDINTWPNSWHLHFDFNGCRNNKFKRRKAHLDKLFRHYDWLSNKLTLKNADFQLYAVISDFNSASDALFLHKHNSPIVISLLKSIRSLQ